MFHEAESTGPEASSALSSGRACAERFALVVAPRAMAFHRHEYL